MAVVALEFSLPRAFFQPGNQQCIGPVKGNFDIHLVSVVILQIFMDRLVVGCCLREVGQSDPLVERRD